MNREVKLALILGTSLVLIVGVLISDHFSGARRAALEGVGEEGLASGFEFVPQQEREMERLPDPGDVAAVPATTAPASATDTRAIDRPVEQPAQTLADSGDAPLELEMGRPPQPGSALADGVQRIIAAAEREGLRIIDLNGAPTAGQTDRTLSREREQVAAREDTPPAETHAQEPRRDVRLYKVQADESLWSIAEREYGDGALYVKLIAFNKDRLMADGQVREGTNIILPTRAELDAGELRPAAARGAVKAPAAKARTYKVEKGDTLGTIAERLLGTSKRWREIVELNKLEDPDRLLVGATLKIPAK